MLQELNYRRDFLKVLADTFGKLSDEWDEADKTLRPALDGDRVKAWERFEADIKKREIEPTLRLRLYTETGDGIKSDDRDALRWFLDGFIKKTEAELATAEGPAHLETRLLLDEARCALRIVEAGKPSTAGLETYEGRA